MENDLIRNIVLILNIMILCIGIVFFGFSVFSKKKQFSIILYYFLPFWIFATIFEANMPQNKLGMINAIIFFLLALVLYINYIIAYRKDKIIDKTHYCISLILSIVFLFSSIYSIIEFRTPGSFSKIGTDSFSKVVDFIYFSIITFTTVGFGDISPQTMIAKFFVMMEVVLAFGMVVLIVILKNIDNIKNLEEKAEIEIKLPNNEKEIELQERNPISMPKEKLKIADEISKIQIDQLHNATLNLSKQCFEIKKLCIVTLTAVFSFFAGVNKRIVLDLPLIISICIITLLFFTVDSCTYYYQNQLRSRIEKEKRKILIRNDIYLEGSKNTEQRTLFFKKSFVKSFFNLSQIMYYILGFIEVVILLITIF